MILLERHKPHNDVATIWLNHPESRNALGDAMITELCQALEVVKKDHTLKCLVIRAKGKVFCSGGDIKAMQNRQGMFAGESYDLVWGYQEGIQRISKLMDSLSLPVIAVVEGAAVGAGCDFACMSDIRLATPLASFQESFARLNLVPGDGGTFFLTRVIGYARAMQMMLTAEQVDAQKALQIGLVNSIHQPHELDGALENLLKQVLAQGAPALALTKMAMRAQWSQGLDRHLELLSALQAIVQRMPEHEGLLQKMLGPKN